MDQGDVETPQAIHTDEGVSETNERSINNAATETTQPRRSARLGSKPAIDYSQMNRSRPRQITLSSSRRNNPSSHNVANSNPNNIQVHVFFDTSSSSSGLSQLMRLSRDSSVATLPTEQNQPTFIDLSSDDSDTEDPELFRILSAAFADDLTSRIQASGFLPPEPPINQSSSSELPRSSATRRRRLNSDVFPIGQILRRSGILDLPPVRRRRVDDSVNRPTASDLGLSQQEYEEAMRAELELQARVRQIKQDERVARNQQYNAGTADPIAYDGNACSICLEDCPKIPTACIFCCQTVGCSHCVKTWFKSALKNQQEQNCPLCRHGWDKTSFKKTVIKVDMSISDDDPCSSNSF